MRIDHHNNGRDSMREDVLRALVRLCSRANEMSASGTWQRTWQVAAELGCSRGTVQTHLRELAHAGRIQSRRGKNANEFQYRV
jgi:DNA-binding CsgD family transcriptional regulator